MGGGQCTCRALMRQGRIVPSALQIRPGLGGEGYVPARLSLCSLSALVFFVVTEHFRVKDPRGKGEESP